MTYMLKTACDTKLSSGAEFLKITQRFTTEKYGDAF